MHYCREKIPAQTAEKQLHPTLYRKKAIQMDRESNYHFSLCLVINISFSAGVYVTQYTM